MIRFRPFLFLLLLLVTAGVVGCAFSRAVVRTSPATVAATVEIFDAEAGESDGFPECWVSFRAVQQSAGFAARRPRSVQQAVPRHGAFHAFGWHLPLRI